MFRGILYYSHSLGCSSVTVGLSLPWVFRQINVVGKQSSPIILADEGDQMIAAHQELMGLFCLGWQFQWARLCVVIVMQLSEWIAAILDCLWFCQVQCLCFRNVLEVALHSAPYRIPTVASLFLTEAVSVCTEQIEPDRKTHTKTS